eukprot:1458391-Lingulodinium_polyedra.AAC.1
MVGQTLGLPLDGKCRGRFDGVSFKLTNHRSRNAEHGVVSPLPRAAIERGRVPGLRRFRWPELGAA